MLQARATSRSVSGSIKLSSESCSFRRSLCTAMDNQVPRSSSPIFSQVKLSCLFQSFRNIYTWYYWKPSVFAFTRMLMHLSSVEGFGFGFGFGVRLSIWISSWILREYKSEMIQKSFFLIKLKQKICNTLRIQKFYF